MWQPRPHHRASSWPLPGPPAPPPNQPKPHWTARSAGSARHFLLLWAVVFIHPGLQPSSFSKARLPSLPCFPTGLLLSLSSLEHSSHVDRVKDGGHISAQDLGRGPHSRARGVEMEVVRWVRTTWYKLLVPSSRWLWQRVSMICECSRTWSPLMHILGLSFLQPCQQAMLPKTAVCELCLSVLFSKAHNHSVLHLIATDAEAGIVE